MYSWEMVNPGMLQQIKLFKKIKIAMSPSLLIFQVPRQRSRLYWSLVMLNIMEQTRAYGLERARVILNCSKTSMFYVLINYNQETFLWGLKKVYIISVQAN